jgi:hypothetical protein
MLNPGYSVIINDFSGDMAVWGSNSIVPAGSLTLQWNAPTGNQNPCDGTTNNGCPTRGGGGRCARRTRRAARAGA